MSRSPAVWSISASVRSTPAIGGDRTPSTCPGVSASSCWRASGEALTRNHGPWAPRIASDDCVRGRARTPARAASHVSQWQFHCGNPPPAAEPRTRTRTSVGIRTQPQAMRPRPRRTAPLLVVQVEGDLATEVNELELGLGPLRTSRIAGHLGTEVCKLNLRLTPSHKTPPFLGYNVGVH